MKSQSFPDPGPSGTVVLPAEAMAGIVGCNDFRNECLVVADAAIEALRGQNTEFASAKSSRLPCFGV